MNDFSKEETGKITRNTGMQGGGMVRNKSGTYAKINDLIVLKRHKNFNTVIIKNSITFFQVQENLHVWVL